MDGIFPALRVCCSGILNGRGLDNGRRTQLIRAIIDDNEAAVQSLLRLPAWLLDANQKDKFGATPLVWAMTKEDPKYLNLLLEREDVKSGINLVDNKGRTALMNAASFGASTPLKTLLQYKLVRLGINHKDKAGKTALMIAAQEGEFDCMSLLLEVKRIDPVQVDKTGNMAHMYAARNKNSACLMLLMQHDAIEQNLCHKNHRGESALHFALRNGRGASLKALNGSVACIKALLDSRMCKEIIQTAPAELCESVAAIYGKIFERYLFFQSLESDQKAVERYMIELEAKQDKLVYLLLFLGARNIPLEKRELFSKRMCATLQQFDSLPSLKTLACRSVFVYHLEDQVQVPEIQRSLCAMRRFLRS